MTVLKEKDGILKCNFCDAIAEYKCAACGSVICNIHHRFGRLYGYNLSKKNEYYCIGCWRVERNTLKKNCVSKISLISGLKKLGLKSGDILIVQSSYSAFGMLEFGAETIIDAISLNIGETGAILMPAFTFSHDNFIMRASKSDLNCGITAELFRRRAKTTRSNNHPLSFTAAGKDAVYYINNAVKYDKLDELSPVKRIMDKNGKLLMLGVEFNNCLPVIYADTVSSKNKIPSCGKKYDIISDAAKNLSSYNEIIIGDALCRIMNIRELVDSVISTLKEKPNIFNCNNNNCGKCMSNIKINKLFFENNRLK